MLGALILAVAALPPVTQAEAVEFHRRGLCQMAEPGQGIARADGRGWIASSLPGRHRVFALPAQALEAGPRTFDVRWQDFIFVPGRPQAITIVPGSTVYWCPEEARSPGRAECGPVPPAFLYDAKLVGDPR